LDNLNYHVSDDDYSYYGYILNEFQKNTPQDFFVNQVDYNYEGVQADNELAIAKKISDTFGDHFLNYRIQHFENNAFYINFYRNDHQVLMLFARIGRRQDFDGNIFGDCNGTFICRISGPKDYVEGATKALSQPPRFQATMKWYFKTDGRTDYRTIDIKQKHPVVDEMYPWIEEGVHTYFKRYLESEANVLVLLGEPGTGKTTFIRELIVRNGLNAMVTYEEELMNADRLYLDLITDAEQDILIMEDADLMLLSRESAGNKTMSKLLNISDGLMKNRKKIIFTANINYNSLSKADSALIRPGRCFDVLNFRSFDHDEAVKAAKAMGLPEPEYSKEITLAKLTNPDYKAPDIEQVGFSTKVGF